MTFVPTGSSTLSKRMAAFPSGVWGRASHGRGPYIVTSDGRTMLDHMCALGALTVGHAHPKIVDAVAKQMSRGSLFSLPADIEERVAERLCGIIPCAEQTKFTMTGSEACSAAVRIARMATGRSKILTTPTSYHGWHDQMIAVKPRHPGVPEAFTYLIDTFNYNDVGSLATALDASSGNGLPVAAVILEPVQGESPAADFLNEVIVMAHARGALVIFDEMLCGGRLTVGGAQQLYDVTPDLATFGKAFGGGLPFAFVAGRKDLMQHAWPCSGTFSGSALSLAACDAMLDLYRDEDVIGRLWKNGQRLQAALLDQAQAEHLTIIMQGHSPRFWWDYAPGVDKRLAQSVFVQKCAKLGQLVHPAVVFANAAMTDEQVSQAIGAFRVAMVAVAQGIKNGNLREFLEGEPYEDSVR